MFGVTKNESKQHVQGDNVFFYQNFNPGRRQIVHSNSIEMRVKKANTDIGFKYRLQILRLTISACELLL